MRQNGWRKGRSVLWLEAYAPRTQSLSKRKQGKVETYESDPTKFQRRIQSMKTYQEEIYNSPNTVERNTRGNKVGRWWDETRRCERKDVAFRGNLGQKMNTTLAATHIDIRAYLVVVCGRSRSTLNLAGGIKNRGFCLGSSRFLRKQRSKLLLLALIFDLNNRLEFRSSKTRRHYGYFRKGKDARKSDCRIKKASSK